MIGCPWQQADEQDNRANIEETDTPDDAVHSARQNFTRIVAFASGSANQFNGGIGKHHTLQQQKDWHDSMREQATVLCDQMKARGVPGYGHPAAENKRSGDEECGKGHNFDERKPELHLTEVADADHVHRANDAESAKSKNPLGDVHENGPVVHVKGDGGDIDDARHGPVEK